MMRYNERVITSLGLAFGGALVLSGLFTYLVVPGLGPNRLLGVRVPYARFSIATWHQSNQVGGVATALVGAGYACLTLLWFIAGLPQLVGFWLLTLAMLATLFVVGVRLWYYARQLTVLSDPHPIARPLPVREWYHLPVVLAFVAVVLTAAYYWQRLPSSDVAAHFTLGGRPDVTSTPATAFTLPLGIAVIVLVAHIALVWFVARRPGLPSPPAPSFLRPEPSTLLTLTSVAFTLAQALFAYALFDIGWYGLRESHILSQWVILVLAVGIAPLVAFAVALALVSVSRPVVPTSPKAS